MSEQKPNAIPNWSKIYGYEPSTPRPQELVSITRHTAHLAISALKDRMEKEYYHNDAAACRELSGALSDGPPAPQEQEKWGFVYNDIEGHWQIISQGGLLIIGEIGEFRYPDTKTEREAHRRLVHSIVDNHNAVVLRLMHNASIERLSAPPTKEKDLGETGGQP